MQKSVEDGINVFWLYTMVSGFSVFRRAAAKPPPSGKQKKNGKIFRSNRAFLPLASCIFFSFDFKINIFVVQNTTHVQIPDPSHPFQI